MFELFTIRYKLYKMYKSWDRTKNSTMLKQIKELEKEIEQKEKTYLFDQTCFIYCPRCGNELIFESHDRTSEYLEYYKCSKCGEESAWNFDIAPVPIRVKNPNVFEYNERVKSGELKPENVLTELEIKQLRIIVSSIYFRHDDKHRYEIDFDSMNEEIVNMLNLKIKEFGKSDEIEAIVMPSNIKCLSTVGLKLKYRSVDYENKR